MKFRPPPEEHLHGGRPRHNGEVYPAKSGPTAGCSVLRDQLYTVRPVNGDIWCSTLWVYGPKSFPLSQVNPVEDSAYIEILIVLRDTSIVKDAPAWKPLLVLTEFDEGRVI